MRAWVVAGPAGSGKSTLGRALAGATAAALLDLDSVTNPLLDALGPALSADGHWNDDRLRALVRPARYACLLATARDQVQAGVDLVLAAPFTAELQGGEEWRRLLAALAPVTPTVVWLDASAAVRQQRMASRGEARDVGRAAARAAAPQVPHVRLEATMPTADQLELLLRSADSGGCMGGGTHGHRPPDEEERSRQA
ncbi:MAG TPA: AAA family ATPase [Marmoricola sp.]